jgi:hypothetical protein
MGWYTDAYAQINQELADLGLTPEQNVWAVAVASPQCPWQDNISLVRRAYQMWLDAEDIGTPWAQCMLSKPQRMLLDQVFSEPPTHWRTGYEPQPLGPKVRAFGLCLLGKHDLGYVPIDRHAYAAWMGDLTLPYAHKLTPRDHELAQADYTLAGQVLGITNAQAQAATWVIVQRLRKEGLSA